MMKTPRLKYYEPIVGKKVINEIISEAKPLYEKHIIHINSTYYGGGVAEMLNSLVPLFNDLGIKTGWRLIKGNPDFFSITKKFHNSIQGEEINLTPIKKKIYEKTNQINSMISHIQNNDCVIIHDPQPLSLINYYNKVQPWIWRCHIDLSNPDEELWKYLKEFIVKYDRIIISKKTFQHDFGIPHSVINPSIDPLAPKNKDISDSDIDKYLKKFNIPRDKPIISQISRFDKWKDPIGVIEAFKIIRKQIDCRLVLLGSMASDDPEGMDLYHKVLDYTSHEKDIIVINFENDILVNALQRISKVVIQKSLKEGFGLTVSEALWKKTPVVASDVGGISLQIKNGVNGYLVDSVETCANRTIKLLKNPKMVKKMGEEGHKIVKEKFLITRHLLDYIRLIKSHIINYKTN